MIPQSTEITVSDLTPGQHHISQKGKLVCLAEVSNMDSKSIALSN